MKFSLNEKIFFHEETRGKTQKQKKKKHLKEVKQDHTRGNGTTPLVLKKNSCIKERVEHEKTVLLNKR